MTWTIHNGDCLEVLRTLPDASVDAVVTDPPYGLSFMGKKWDYDVPSVDVWVECLRVLKPGGHLLAFAGTRTQHRMAVRIEDAGFEIRDMIAWVYGSGFPKSLDVSKAIDKAAGAEREVVGHKTAGTGSGKTFGMLQSEGNNASAEKLVHITAPATDAARQWSGWGTALKPALEPITVARKPLVGTVAENVLQHGTGGINVDGCRVGTTVETWPASRSYGGGTEYAFTHTGNGVVNSQPTGSPPPGRWPANVIHDGSDEVLRLFPGNVKGVYGAKAIGKVQFMDNEDQSGGSIGSGNGTTDIGSAARFFYCAKASKADRDEGCEGLDVRQTVGGGGLGNPVSGAYGSEKAPARNHHPTVKPTALMRYLCRLVTPPGGVVLDPFTGSGSTGKAAIMERFKFIGIEREAEYCEIARARISKAERDVSKELL